MALYKIPYDSFINPLYTNQMSKEIQKQPETSLAAYHSLTNEKLTIDHSRIIDALERLGKANYEQIAAMAKMDRIAVGRRLKELEVKQLIYKPGTKSFLKSGRYGFDYCLRNPPKVERMPPLRPLNKPIYATPTLF